MLSAFWLQSSVPGRAAGRKEAHGRGIASTCLLVGLSLGQQLWHTARIQQLFDEKLYKNMIHVECVKTGIVVLGLEEIKYLQLIVFSIWKWFYFWDEARNCEDYLSIHYHYE